jgi:hypothetical protein
MAGDTELARCSLEAVRKTPGYAELFPALAEPDKQQNQALEDIGT